MSRTKLIYGFGVWDVPRPAFWKDESGELHQDLVYRKYQGMLKRCYSPEWHEKQPTYVGCTVDDVWRSATAFERWLLKHDGWEEQALDKDILVPGNKVYSPDNCCVVPAHINTLFGSCRKARGAYPIGVQFHKPSGRFRSVLRMRDKRVSLGYFSTADEAHKTYCAAKAEYIRFVAHSETSGAVQKGMLKWAVLYDIGAIR